MSSHERGYTPQDQMQLGSVVHRRQPYRGGGEPQYGQQFPQGDESGEGWCGWLMRKLRLPWQRRHDEPQQQHLSAGWRPQWEGTATTDEMLAQYLRELEELDRRRRDGG
jgi:hypothetical protein